MRVIDPGHVYVLDSLDGNYPQLLTFVKRTGPMYPGNGDEPHAGTIMQEVFRALLDRARYVNRQIPCPETDVVIASLQTALFALESRAKRRKGKHLEETSLAAIEAALICPTCGHISCKEEHACS